MGRYKWSYKSPNQCYIYGYPISTPSYNYPRTSKRRCLGFGVEGCFGVQASGIKVFSFGVGVDGAGFPHH